MQLPAFHLHYSNLAPHKQAKNDQLRTPLVPDTGHMSSEIIVTADR